MNDHRGQHRLGQVGEQRRQGQHGDQAEQGGDHRRQLGAGAGAVVDGGLRQAAAGGQPAEQAGADVGQAQRDHVLAGVQPVAVLVGERLRGAERLAEDHQHHAGRAGQQHPQVGTAELRPRAPTAARRRPSRPYVRRACRGAAPVLMTMAATSTTSPPGTFGTRSRANSRTSATAPTANVDQLASPRWADQVRELADGVTGALGQAEQLGQLADRDEDGQPEHEPFHHRPGQELGDEAEPAQPADEEQQAGQDDHPRGQVGIRGRVLRVQVGDRGVDQHRRGGGAGHHQLLAGAEDRVRAQRREQRVQARPAAAARPGWRTRSSPEPAGPRS